MGYQEDYINTIAPYVVYYARKYGVLCPSGVIAQGCLETGCGNSNGSSNTLCWQHHNFFGLKCGSRWTGGRYNTKTHEVYNGVRTVIKDDFRTYPSIAAGVEGYFIFTQVENVRRYGNVRSITDPGEYVAQLGRDGYYTSSISSYRAGCMSYVRRYDLKKYDSMIIDSLPDADSSQSGYYQTSTEEMKNEPPKVFTAQSTEKENKWGKLRYFEEISDPSVGQAKADMLLNLYARRTRELKVSDAFGDKTVRAGTLIPVFLNLGDVETSNYMLVDKVTHKFSKDSYTMDLTLQGAWDD